MHQLAEHGVAAHWRYKESGGARDARYEERMSWLRQLLEWQRDISHAEEFVESVKADLFHDQVFVYTPKGEIKEMPAGATPIDFAYRVHTDLGHQCVGGKVNGRLVPLNYQLQNGDVVEIVSAKNSRGPVARLAEREPRLHQDRPLAREDPPVVQEAGARREHRARPRDDRQGAAPPQPLAVRARRRDPARSSSTTRWTTSSPRSATAASAPRTWRCASRR